MVIIHSCLLADFYWLFRLGKTCGKFLNKSGENQQSKKIMYSN